MKYKFDYGFAVVIAIALLTRIAAVFAFPSIHHWDENFQVLEQAHRLAFGYGVVPWEFRLGARSPVLPLIFAQIFSASEPLVGGPEGYIFAARVVTALSSVIAVAAVYRFAATISSVHALIAGLATATWFELVYFADRPTPESFATTILLSALSLAGLVEQKPTRSRLVLLGFCIGLCFMLRIQLAPGLFVLAAWIGRQQIAARWLPMLLGAIGPVLAFGAIDWFYWGAPFSSYLKYIEANLIDDRAAIYGTEPIYWYFGFIFVTWTWATPLILALLLRARGILLLWIAVALAIILIHAFIPHKEYRFILPAIACLIVAAAIASADVLQRYAEDVPLLHKRLALAAVALLWVLASASLAFTGSFRDQWFAGRPVIEASFDLSKFAPLCGVLLADELGGYAHLHRAVPMYRLAYYCGEDGLRSCSSDAFNAMIIPCTAMTEVPPAFRLYRRENGFHRPDACIMVRDGSCAAASELEINAMLRAQGQ